MNRENLICLLSVVSLTVATVHATSIKSVSLGELFKQTDVVALIHITGGDEASDRVVYRAAVIQSFKGTTPNATIYFGPHSTYRIGADYVAFLKRTDDLVGKVFSGSANPWPEAASAPYFEIPYAGYSILPVEYTCDLPGCDYGVLVPSSQVHLPGGVPTVVATRERSSTYDAWVKKAAMLELLGELKAGSAQ